MRWTVIALLAFARAAYGDTCGNGVVDGDGLSGGEWCDIAIPAGQAGACPTQAYCQALPAGSLGGGCDYYLAGSGCQAHCLPGSGDCYSPPYGSGSGSGSATMPAADDSNCSVAGGASGLVVGLAALFARRRRARHECRDRRRWRS